MKTLALDTHTHYCNLSIRNKSGKEIGQQTIRTETGKLIEAIQEVRNPKTLVIEEGPLADWLKRTLQPYVTRFVICDPKRNHWIANDEAKNDQLDATKLSHLFWGGYIKEVHHPALEKQHFKALVLHYHRQSRQLARCKNILKAKFAQQGILLSGTALYGHTKREKLLKGVVHPLAKAEIEDLYLILDATKTVQETIKKRLSGKKLKRQKRNQAYNRFLKSMAKQAAQSALLTKEENLFQRKYHHLIQKGTNPKQAHVIVARSIITTLWRIWLKQQPFNPTYQTPDFHKN